MFSFVYGLVVEARNALYERKALKSFSLGAPTVSVGNLTVGGTGKTPLVAFIAEVLSANGERVCVLSRGYKRANPKRRVLVSDGEKIFAGARESGDEPLELARKLLKKAFVVSDANRVAAAKWAREKFRVTAFVLDDAFQHRRARRDFDVVTVDATNAFGNEKLVPQGILRERPKNLNRADAIVITRSNLIGEKRIAELKNQISSYNPRAPIFVAANKFAALVRLENFRDKQKRNSNPEQQITNEELTRKKSFAFCALGNAENFFEQLRRENFDLVDTLQFADHYFYARKDVEKIEKALREKGAEILITTAKDAVKLKDFDFGVPCFAAENRLLFDDETKFKRLLLEAVGKAREKKSFE